MRTTFLDAAALCVAIAAAATATAVSAQAPASAVDHAAHHPPVAASGSAPSPATRLAEGEVRRIDREQKKITLRHGPIASLDMPPMTMVFQVADEAMLAVVKVGDQVRFAAQKADAALVLTTLEKVPE